MGTVPVRRIRVGNNEFKRRRGFTTANNGIVGVLMKSNNLKHFRVYLNGGKVKTPYSVNVDAPAVADVLALIYERHADVDMFTEISITDRETNILVYPAPGAKRSKGRPRRNIELNLICDALKRNPDVKTAAAALGVSRAYIYKVAGVDKVREIMNRKNDNNGKRG